MTPKYCRYMVSVALSPRSCGNSLRTKGRSNKSPEPENRHEARAEKDDREQRRNVVDPGEQKSQPPQLNGSLGESSVGEQYSLAPVMRRPDFAPRTARPTAQERNPR